MERHAETVMVRGEAAPRGEEGERLLVNGQRMAMRLWEQEKVGVGKPDHANPYEYVAYVIKGALRITIDNHKFEVRQGDSYCVPANTTYSLEVLEEATVVEATSPPDRGAVTPNREVMRSELKRIAVIPGDGIGPEVVREAVGVLERLGDTHDLKLELKHFDWGADKFLREGVSLPEGALEMLSEEFNAIFAGAFGDPRVPSNKHAEDILLGMRRGLDLYINLRPVRLLNKRLTPLSGRDTDDIDFVVLRENTEGAYCGAGGFLKKGTADEIATQEELNTRKGVERIIVAAFEYARAHGRRRVTMADKSNVQRFGGDLWQRVFREVAARYTDIEAVHQYVDAMAMFMVLDPKQYEVVVTNNLFGDILTDLGAALQGGLGMAASGNIHPGRVSLFEPVHGSAPPLAGKSLANPVGAILTAAMMLEYLGHKAASEAVEEAVRLSIEHGETTPDLGGTLTTAEVGEKICRVIARSESAK